MSSFSQKYVPPACLLPPNHPDFRRPSKSEIAFTFLSIKRQLPPKRTVIDVFRLFGISKSSIYSMASTSALNYPVWAVAVFIATGAWIHKSAPYHSDGISSRKHLSKPAWTPPTYGVMSEDFFFAYGKPPSPTDVRLLAEIIGEKLNRPVNGILLAEWIGKAGRPPWLKNLSLSASSCSAPPVAEWIMLLALIGLDQHVPLLHDAELLSMPARRAQSLRILMDPDIPQRVHHQLLNNPTIFKGKTRS